MYGVTASEEGNAQNDNRTRKDGAKFEEQNAQHTNGERNIDQRTVL